MFALVEEPKGQLFPHVGQLIDRLDVAIIGDLVDDWSRWLDIKYLCLKHKC